MSEPEAPMRKNVVTYTGVCSDCATKVKRPKYKDHLKADEGLYVRCECGQINRCFQ